MSGLPLGWIETTLGKITRAEYGKGLRAADRDASGSVPVYGSAGHAGFHSDSLVTEPAVIVGRKGNAGACFVSTTPSWPIDTTYFLRVPDGVIAHFLGYQLQTLRLGSLDSSTAIPSLRRPDLESALIALPPVNEQRRIVAAIEEHLSRLDAADATLRQALRRLELLSAVAFTSSLNGDWPQMQLSEIAATTSGGTPSRRHPEYFNGSIPWVKSGELRDGRVVSTEETITEIGLRESSAKVFPRGTLLIALYGATIGKLGILDIDAATNQAICAIKPHDPEAVPYLRLVLRSKRAELIAAGQGGAQPNISQAILRRLSIPCPPLEEQRRIVAEVEARLSALDALRASIERAQRRSRALRAAVLAQAFRGELVPQDPSDEPASVLLDRVRAERAAAIPTRRRSRPRARTSTELDVTG